MGLLSNIKHLGEGIALRAGLFFARLTGADKVVARYEAAYQQWGQRSFIFGTVQDAKYDANASTRIELVRRHRQWTVNNGIVYRIRMLWIQFAVGVEGLAVVPNSQGESWNVNHQERYQDWCSSPELGSNMSMGALHLQWAGATFDDGEVFILLTSRKDGARTIPAIQTIEAHRVATPKELKDRESKDVWDGIRYDDLGKPVSYFIRTLNSQDEYVETPADEVIHIFKARRPGMGRGLPEGYSVMNDLHDFDDLQNLEMRAAKAAARITNVVRNAAGEADPAALRRSKMSIQTQDAAGNAVVKNDPTFYNVTLGGDTIFQRKGDEIEQFQSARPSVATQQFYDYLTSKICCGYNVPKLLVMPYSLQGTVTRADLDVCTGAFRMNFELFKQAATKIYNWFTQWAVDYDRTMGKYPDDYKVCVCRPPRAPNVDVGKNAMAMAIELKLGTSTYQDLFSERQQDWRQQFRQAAEAAKYLEDLKNEFGLDSVDQIAQKLELQVEPAPKQIPDTEKISL